MNKKETTKKRIGIDVHMLGNHSGGNETYYVNILKYMEVPKDIEIILFVKPSAEYQPWWDKFTIVKFKSKTAFCRNFLELTLLCFKYKLDILHTQYFIPFIRPCRVMCTIHDICFEHYSDIFTLDEYIRQKILIPYAAHRSVAIITNSLYSKEDISKTYGIDKEKIVSTFIGANEMFKKLNEEDLNLPQLKGKFGIKGDYILSVGNLQPRKNIKRLIEAYDLFLEKYNSEVELVLVGKKAWMYDEILSASEKNRDRIHFTEYVDEKDLVRIYNGAGGFVYPSYFEGFGIPPLEAMACGVKVAVANATSLPEVVADAGLYFDPYNIEEIADSLYKLINDHDSDEELYKNMAKQVEKFDLYECSKRLADKYVELINE